MKALILIGLQVDLLPLGAAEIAGSESILPVINKWLSEFEQVVAARFSHPADHKMFVANYPWRRPGQEINLMGEKILLKNYFCMKDSFGAELTMGFDHQQITHTVWMGTDRKLLPYSAFYDENQGRDTGLANFLKEQGITDIYLAGLPFEEGVHQTALDGLAEGFGIHILENAVKGREEEAVKASMQDLTKKGIQWIKTNTPA